MQPHTCTDLGNCSRSSGDVYLVSTQRVISWWGPNLAVLRHSTARASGTSRGFSSKKATTMECVALFDESSNIHRMAATERA